MKQEIEIGIRKAITDNLGVFAFADESDVEKMNKFVQEAVNNVLALIPSSIASADVISGLEINVMAPSEYEECHNCLGHGRKSLSRHDAFTQVECVHCGGWGVKIKNK